MKSLFQLLTLVVLLTACNANNIDQKVTIKNKYSIGLPSSLTKSEDKTADASLEYENLFQEYYILIIDESKEEFKLALEENDLLEDYAADLNGYGNILVSSIKDEINVKNISPLKEEVINGLPTKTVEVEGEIEGIEVYYSLTFLEGKDDYYQISHWTLIEYKDRYQDLMKKSIRSFKEL